MTELINWCIRKMGGVTKDDLQRTVDLWAEYANEIEDIAKEVGAVEVLNATHLTQRTFSVPVILRNRVVLHHNVFEGVPLMFRPDSSYNVVSNCCFKGKE